MMTAEDIEALREKLREAKDLDGLQRLGHELLLHAPELLARAAAWERVLGQRHNTDRDDALFEIIEATIEWDDAAEKGFEP